MARTNLQIKVGTYTGDGQDNRNITGIGFRPDFLLIKGGSNWPVFRIKEDIGDNTHYFSQNVADLANSIQALMNDGFQLGSNATVNANGTVYYYLAIKGYGSQKYFATGKYLGNNTDNRNFITGGFNFTPDLVMIKNAEANDIRWASSAMSEGNADGFGYASLSTNCIQNLQANGFQLGNDAAVGANNVLHFFLVMKQLAGVMKVGSYVGNGVDNRVISGIGFTPDLVIVKKHVNGTYVNGNLKTTNMDANTSIALINGGNSTTQIKTLQSDGFILGTGSSSNADTILYQYIALKAGNFNVPIVRTLI